MRKEGQEEFKFRHFCIFIVAVTCVIILTVYLMKWIEIPPSVVNAAENLIEEVVELETGMCIDVETDDEELVKGCKIK